MRPLFLFQPVQVNILSLQLNSNFIIWVCKRNGNQICSLFKLILALKLVFFGYFNSLCLQVMKVLLYILNSFAYRLQWVGFNIIGEIHKYSYGVIEDSISF